MLNNKRGVSPVIATVLLIVLAIVLVGIVFLWMSSFVAEQLEKQGKPTEQVCNDVEFAIEAEYDTIGRTIGLQVVNRGNVNIYGFDINFVGTKDSSMKSFKFNVPVGEASDLQVIPIVTDVKKVVLYPMLLGSVKGKKVNKPVTCLGKGKTFEL